MFKLINEYFILFKVFLAFTIPDLILPLKTLLSNAFISSIFPSTPSAINLAISSSSLSDFDGSAGAAAGAAAVPPSGIGGLSAVLCLFS